MKLQYLEAGEIVTTHGVRGELKVLPWADDAQFLCQFHRVIIDAKTYEIENCRVQKTCNLLKLQGVDTIEQAQGLRGKIVNIYREDAPKDLIFAAELVGVQVYSSGEFLGEVKEVLDYPGNKVYVVKGTQEYMIPAVKQFIKEIDMDKNEMQVALIEGMGSNEN